MTLVGCDLHTRKQQVAVLHTDTGEVVEQELLHAGDAVEQSPLPAYPWVSYGLCFYSSTAEFPVRHFSFAPEGSRHRGTAWSHDRRQSSPVGAEWSA
jgi:hypothetical protein